VDALDELLSDGPGKEIDRTAAAATKE